MQILLKQEDLSKYLKLDVKTIKLWTRLGFLNKVEGMSLAMYDKFEVDTWIASGDYALLWKSGSKRKKGVYGS